MQCCTVADFRKPIGPSLTIDPPLCPQPNPPNPHQERQQHGVQLAQLDAAMGELKHELTRAREAEAAEARRRERDDGLRIDALQKEVRRMTAVAQQYLQARLIEVEVAHEERERVTEALQEAKAAAAMAEQQVAAREWRAAAAAEVQLVDAAREMRDLQGQIGLQSVAEVLSNVSKSQQDDRAELFEQRAERAEAALSDQARQAESLLRNEREQATQQAKALRQQLVSLTLTLTLAAPCGPIVSAQLALTLTIGA